ncbi:unnamed protein product, partial [Urochloa humidicola]
SVAELEKNFKGGQEEEDGNFL